MKVQDQVVENPVFMLIGESPGAEEAACGRPFVGKAGQQLDKLLLAVGINREECYITNVVDERPPGNNFGKYYEDSKRTIPTAELLQAKNKLKEKINIISPKIVISFGNESLFAIKDVKGITDRRGSIYGIENLPTKIIPTIHPSAIVRGGGTSHWYLPAVYHDLKRAVEESKTTEGAKEIEYEIVKDTTRLEEFFREVSNGDQPCSFDIETTMQGGENIRCIGFASGSERGIVIPFQDITDAFQYDFLRGVFRKWYTGTQIKWIGQNAYGFDINYIKRVWKFDCGNFFWDTMVAHHIVHPEMPHDLGFLTSYYTRIPYYKDEIDTDLYQYNAKDAVATWIIAQKQQEELQKRGLLDLYRDYYHPLLECFREMNFRGVRINREYQKELRRDLKEEIKTMQTDIDSYYTKYTNSNRLKLRLRRVQRFIESDRKTVKLWNPKRGKSVRKRKTSYARQLEDSIEKARSLNVRSVKDLSYFLYTVLKLPKKSKHGKITTDANAINQLFVKTKHPFLRTIILQRRTLKSLSDWGQMKTDTDGRIRTTYSFAETGRLRSGKFEAK